MKYRALRARAIFTPTSAFALLAVILGPVGCGGEDSEPDSTDGSGGLGAAGAGAAVGGTDSVGAGGTGGTSTAAGGNGGVTPAGMGGAPNATGGAPNASTGGAPMATGGAAAGGSAGSVETGGAAGTPTSVPCLDFGEPMKIASIQSRSVVPPSGIVASREHPGVLYFQEDAGGGASFFALDTSGATLGEYALSGATAVDWEDIAVGPGPGGTSFVYLGDFGDNAARFGTGTVRSEIEVYRAPEPDVSPTQSATQASIEDWQVFRFTYPDGPHDAETLLVDPPTGDIFVVTKESDGNSSIFRAAADTPVDTSTVLEKVGNVQFASSGQGAQATAGDISPTGDRVIIRTYTAILLWSREAGSTVPEALTAMPKTLMSPTERQGEGLTFSADGLAWYSAGEMDASIYEGKATCTP